MLIHIDYIYIQSFFLFNVLTIDTLTRVYFLKPSKIPLLDRFLSQLVLLRVYLLFAEMLSTYIFLLNKMKYAGIDNSFCSYIKNRSSSTSP